MSIDPRLSERRKVVAEDQAKRSVTRLLRFLAFVVVVGGLTWVAFSPWFSVSAVTTEGVEQSHTHLILNEWGFRAGEPMIRLDVAGVTAALEADPWVADAEVVRLWPNRVSVDISERVPVAWVETASGWVRRDVNGAPVPSESEPTDEMGHISLPDVADEDARNDPFLLGAVQFFESLAPDRAGGAQVYERDGELWAIVSGYQVRLGRPIDMDVKAFSLDALLDQQIAPGSTLILVAPKNPAVSTPSDDTVDDSDTGEGGDDG